MNVKIIPTLIVKIIIRAVYSLCSVIFPIDENKVTFASYRSEKLEGNLYYIHKELVERETKLTFVFLFKKYKSSGLGKVHYFFHMIKASYQLATSKYFFIDDFYFPVYVISPREGSKIIQLWHAVGAFKKFGYSTIGKSFGPSHEYLKHVKIHSNYTDVFVSSKEVIPYYAEAFNMERKDIHPLGVPRTDFFFNANELRITKSGFYKDFPEMKGKKVILYAPTYRGNSHAQNNITNHLDIPALKEILGQEYRLLIHLHPYMRGDFLINDNDKGFASHIKHEYSVEELLTITDILITDYSSIIFDFSLLNRPMAFLATDLVEYRKERDFYFEYENFLPGPLFKDTKDLAVWVKNGKFDLKRVSSFRDKFFEHQDGKSSYRIINHLLMNENQELEELSKGINF